jgi:hypothetical protein
VPAPPATLASALASLARDQVGIVEVPPHSNRGSQVEAFQRSTGALGQPWCVSFRQWLDIHVIGSTYAQGTANAYAYAAWAVAHDDVRLVPLIGDAVVYHLGAGHMGTVVAVGPRVVFVAVEGNEGDAVKLVERSTVGLRCTFVRRAELHRHV